MEIPSYFVAFPVAKQGAKGKPPARQRDGNNNLASSGCPDPFYHPSPAPKAAAPQGARVPPCIQAPNVSHLLLCWRNTPLTQPKIAAGSSRWSIVPGSGRREGSGVGDPRGRSPPPRVVPPCPALARGQPSAPALQPISGLPGRVNYIYCWREWREAGGRHGEPGAGTAGCAPGLGDSESFP